MIMSFNKRQQKTSKQNLATFTLQVSMIISIGIGFFFYLQVKHLLRTQELQQLVVRLVDRHQD